MNRQILHSSVDASESFLADLNVSVDNWREDAMSNVQLPD
jgi:hypothetical protein